MSANGAVQRDLPIGVGLEMFYLLIAFYVIFEIFGGGNGGGGYERCGLVDNGTKR